MTVLWLVLACWLAVDTLVVWWLWRNRPVPPRNVRVIGTHARLVKSRPHRAGRR